MKKTNEKRGQLDRKSRCKLVLNAYKLFNNTFILGEKSRLPIVPCVSGPKYNRHNAIFSAERGGQ